MAVTQADRDYMRRIGAQKALSHAEAAADHMDCDIAARLARSWELSSGARERASSRAFDDETPDASYALARARGLVLR